MNDPWIDLRRYTQARIAQGRAGCGTPTVAQLDFQLAHAMARDAVHLPWAVDQFAAALFDLGLKTVSLATATENRGHYLQRPDLGRCLKFASRQRLQVQPPVAIDVALIVSNGLSSAAVTEHGLPLVQAIVSAYRNHSLRIGPICLVENARVALSDEIGALLNARLAVMVIGERPVLSAADSLGIYLTYAPSPGKTDAERNCLSNIRPPQGQSYLTAAEKLACLSREALRLGLSGVALKDDMPDSEIAAPNEPGLSQESID